MFVTEEWGYNLEALPEQLYIPILEWASGEGTEEYAEAVNHLVETGQAKEVV
jgi:hypothetical protein